jgi:hypothetical protein
MRFGIFLDDERDVEDVFWIDYPESVSWQVVRTYNEFVSAVRENIEHPHLISFDHDLQDFTLSGSERTGYDCVKFLVDYCIENEKVLPECLYHTQNPVGKLNMQSYM